MKTCILKRLTVISVFTIGVCFSGYCNKPTPEQVAERTNLLFHAIASNDVEQAKACIEFGANVNAIQGEEGPTPLLYAIQKNRIEMVEVLAKSKVDLNKASRVTDRRKWTPLALACAKGNYDVVNILIKYGADVNRDDGHSSFPINHAASMGKNDIVSLLIKSGADVNAKSKSGFTPLMSGSENMAVVETLIKAGADINGKDNEGRTVLMLASTKEKNNDIVAFLIKSGADVNAKDNHGSSALWYANYKSKDRFLRPNEGIIAQLLAAGATE